MIRAWFSCLFAAALAACGSVPLVVVGMDAQQIQRVTDFELCWASSTLLETRGRQFPTIENEIARRGLNCGGERATAQTAELGNEVMMDPAGVELPAQSAGAQTSVLRNVNMRAGPGTEHPVRRVLQAGETVMVLRVLGTWCECMDGSATVYVSCANLAPPTGGWARLMAGSWGGDLRFAQGTLYPQVRRRLLETGWRPFPLRGRYARGCQPNEACMGFPETAFCTGTGMNSCWYSWRRGEEYLLATASGENAEDGQAFDELRRCSRLVYSEGGHPWDWCSAAPASGATRLGSQSLPALVQRHRAGWAFMRGNQICGADARSSVNGDFNGDGQVDYATRLSRGNQAQIAAFLSAPQGYRVVVLEQGTRPEMDSQRLDVRPRGSRHFVIDRTDRPRRPMTLPYDAPEGGTCESSSYIYLIQGSTVRRAFTSD